MKITLSQNEIEQAVQTYMNTLISIPADKQVSCEFTTTRSPFSIMAEINIENKQAEKPVEATLPSTPIIEPEEEENALEEPASENTVHSLFGSLK